MKAKNLLVLLVAALAGAGAVWAKGPPQKVTISGGELEQEIILTGDPAALDALAMMTLEDYSTRTPDAPEGISGEGYLLTRYFEDSNSILKDRYFPFDQVRYYRDPDGGRGYLNYVGIIGGSSEYDGQWFRPNADGELALQRLIVDGETVQSLVRSRLPGVVLRLVALISP